MQVAPLEGEAPKVEVKGTQTAGLEVLLTPGEVAHARRHHPNTVLFIVHSIVLQGSSDSPVATSGSVRIISPWDIGHARLSRWVTSTLSLLAAKSVYPARGQERLP